MSDVVQLEVPHWAPHMCTGLRELYDEKIGCNVAIYGSDGGILDGHACVLMAASPTLKTWLAGDPIQGCHSVEIDTITCDTWRLLLDFIYSGRARVEKDVVHEVLDAAEKLGMVELSVICKTSLNSSKVTMQTNPAPTPIAIVKEEYPAHLKPIDLKKEPQGKAEFGNTDDKPLDLTKENSITETSEKPKVTGNPAQNLIPLPLPPSSMSGSSDPQMQAVMAMYYNQMLQYSVLAQNMNNSSSNGSESKPPVPNALSPMMPKVPSMPPSAMSVVPQQVLQQQMEMQQDGRQRKFACTICGMLFFTRHVKEQHELTHTNLKPYSCNICGFKARQKAVIWRHKKNRHPEAESSVSMDVLTSAIPSSPDCEENEEENATCNQLNHVETTTPESDTNEAKMYTSSAPPPPTMPGLTAISAISPITLSQQIPQPISVTQPSPTATDPTKPYICNTCGRGFKNKYILSQHSMIHSNVRRYACDICGFRAKQMSVIYNHKRNKHWGKKMDQEMLNPAITMLPQSMSNAMPYERSVPEHQSAISHEAESKSLQNKDDMQNQEGSLKDIELEVQNAQRTIDGYLCRICGRSLKTKMILQEHIMTHYNIRRYPCHYCNYRAKQRAGLYNHMKVKHKGLKPVRPLKNKRINLGFTSSYMAEKITKFNPFNPMRRKHMCRTCGKSFRIKHVLEQHELIHLNIKRYACKYCGFKGKQKSVIYRHNQIKHADKKACVVDILKGKFGGFKPIEIKPTSSAIRKEEAEPKKHQDDNSVPTDLSKPKEEINMQRDKQTTPEPLLRVISPEVKIKNHIQSPFMSSTPQFKPQVSFMPQLMGSNLVYSMPVTTQQPTTPSPRPVVTTIQPVNGSDTPPALYSSYGTPDKPHRCKTCGRCFRLRHVMEQHELTHSNFRKYMCDICGFRAKQKAVIYRHKKVKHPNHPGAGRVALVPEMSVPSQYPAVISGPIDVPPQLIPINKISPSNNPELAHNNNKGIPAVIRISPTNDSVKSLEDEKPSPTGSLSFSPHGNMGWYLPPDKDDSEEDMEDDMEFSTGDSLATNMAMGLPSMAPSANTLNLSLPSMPPLSPEQHSPGSDGNKKYSCKVCGRSFKHRHVLEQHYITHTGLRPYKCEFCDFCARQKASLWRHKQKHLIPAQL